MNVIAEMSRRAGDVIRSCTLWPWVIIIEYHEPVQYGADGQPHTELSRFRRHVEIVQATLDDAPDGLDLVPVDATLLRVDVFPASRFDDMPPHLRTRYKPEYRAFRMWRQAMAIGKPVGMLEPWKDYDCVLIDESVERWANPGVRFAGD